MEKIFCVISHTHWDREWYLPFEKFRVRLVDLIDNLLEVLAENPEYVFHLDAQTVVLEDYLAIRPYRREILMKHIREGRILVGPWYVQNDFYLTSGEATIRNLLIGSQMAEEMGKCARVGYTPDQFGLIGQLPQLFKGFGVDSCIFGRGYFFYKEIDGVLQKQPQPAEFIWRADDGSEVLAIHMPFWYNNAQRFSADIAKTLKLLRKISAEFEGIAMTPYLLLMNGVDHLEAQENLLPVLKETNQRLEKGSCIEQWTMPDYIQALKQYLADQKLNLSVYQGELRNGENHNILHGTLSSRVYLKIANAAAQILLENYLEPIYSFVGMAGGGRRYPADYLSYLWKLLIQNHPHDSICGCSVDPVHRHMEDRFLQINELGEELLHRGMDFIAAHVNRTGLTGEEYLLTVFNTIGVERCGIVTADLLFQANENVTRFRLLDPQRNEVPYSIIQKGSKKIDTDSPINLPGIVEVLWYQIQFYVSPMDELSYRSYIIKPVTGVPEPARLQSESEMGALMRNEFLEVKINQTGKIDLKCKESGLLYPDILQFEDTADCGDSYIYLPVVNGRKFTAHDFKLISRTFSGNEFSERLVLRYEMLLPETFDFNTMTRSEILVANRLEIELYLGKESRFLEVNFIIENHSKDHRLRTLIHTGVNSDETVAATPFGVVKKDRNSQAHRIKGDGVEPDTGFVDISRENGLAILNKGLYDYEHLPGDAGVIAITLLRANGRITQSADTKRWLVPGNQCLREIKCSLAIYPHTGGWRESRVPVRTQDFQVPLLAYFSPVDVRKFGGGRPAVQDSEIQEIFFRNDPFAGLELPLERQFIKINGEGILLSALKKAENEDIFILRFYNTLPVESRLELEYFQPIHQAFIVNLKEEKAGILSFQGNKLEPVDLSPGQILTLMLK